MELHFIDKATELNLVEYKDEGEAGRKFTAYFYEVEQRLFFLVDGIELVLEFDNFTPGTFFMVEWFRGKNMYTFKAQISEKVMSKSQTWVKFKQVSDIKETSRRKSPRVDISVKVSVYGVMKNLEMQGLSQDISSDGICVLSTTGLLQQAPDFKFILEFNIEGYNFVLPATLVRRGTNTQTSQFKYIYSFLFDFSENQEKRQRLITEMFGYKLSINKR